MNTLKDFVNWKLAHADKVAEAEGCPLVMENCKKNKKMKQLEIYGNSFQNGTPTPENPIEVQSVGELVTDVNDINYGKYKIPVVCRGKNIATAYDVCKKLASYMETTLDGRECVMYQSNNWAPEADYYKFKENTQYTVSFDVKSVRWESLGGSNCILGFSYTDGTFGKEYLGDAFYVTDTTEWRKVTITSQAGKTVMGITTDSNHHALRHYIDVNTFLLEESISVTEYEPYAKPVTTNIFLDEPLRKLGDYADFVDFKENKVVRNVNVQTIERTAFNKVTIASNNRTSCIFYKDILPNGIFPNTISKCNYFSYGYEINNFRIQDAIYIYLPTDIYPSDIEVNTWLKGVSESDNPIVITYPLVIPTEETLTLNLPKLTAKTTIIEVATSLAPSNIYGKYIKK